MAKRRGNNEGTTYRLEDGSWRSQITLEGRRLSKSAKTRRECEEWRKKKIRQIDKGLTYISTKMTLSEYMTSWLSSVKASYRQTTWTHYNHVSLRYILPKIGKIKISDLRTNHIQNLYDSLLHQGVGVYTILKIHAVLHRALSQASRTGMIGQNPATNTIRPKPPVKEKEILDESQVNQILVGSKGTRLGPIIHLALVTGLRQMELLGLKWSDLDTMEKTLRVERQLERPNSQGSMFAPPKSKAGIRTLSIGSTTNQVLLEHYEGQESERSVAGERWQDHELIFTTSKGTPINPRNLLRDFKRLLAELDLPEITFHELRHTCASILLKRGIPLIDVSRLLGHSRPSITLNIYGHLIPSLQAETAEKIDVILAPVELHQIAPKLHRKQITNRA
ncbi:MAG: tyrosine-type recombinase/integrase [Candidatus Thorarchaeota archaeon]